MANTRQEGHQTGDQDQEDRNSKQGFDHDSREFRQDQGWPGSDQSTLGSLGVSDYDSEFRSGRGSFSDRDTDHEGSSTGTLVNSTPFAESGEDSRKEPVGDKSADDLILEDANEHLIQHNHIDASNITVTVHDGEVTLAGTVMDDDQKHYAGEAVEKIHGVNNVLNHLRIQKTA